MIDYQIINITLIILVLAAIFWTAFVTNKKFPEAPDPGPMPDDFPTFKRIPMPECKPLKDYVCIHALWRNSCHVCDDVHIKAYEEAFPEDQVIRLGGRRIDIVKRLTV